jgi:hypothetical protein
VCFDLFCLSSFCFSCPMLPVLLYLSFCYRGDTVRTYRGDTVRTYLESNRKIVERGKIDIHSRHIHYRYVRWSRTFV